MVCPKCQGEMTTAAFGAIEVERCLNCSGLWFDAESEIVRYLGWPGQAIAYKVGEKFILDLRDERSHDPGFDLKTFHADLLSLGSLGLDLLEELMSPTA